MSAQQQSRRAAILNEIAAERLRQDAKWGEQNHPDGTGPGVMWAGYEGLVLETGQQIDCAEDLARYFGDQCKANGPGEDNWLDILIEEVAEAFAESDPARLRAELVQVAAVAAQWIECIDRRAASDAR